MKSKGSHDIAELAPGMAKNKGPSVSAFANGKTIHLIVMRRTLRSPAGRQLHNALKAAEHPGYRLTPHGFRLFDSGSHFFSVPFPILFLSGAFQRQFLHFCEFLLRNSIAVPVRISGSRLSRTE